MEMDVPNVLRVNIVQVIMQHHVLDVHMVQLLLILECHRVRHVHLELTTILTIILEHVILVRLDNILLLEHVIHVLHHKYRVLVHQYVLLLVQLDCTVSMHIVTLAINARRVPIVALTVHHLVHNVLQVNSVLPLDKLSARPVQ